AVTGPISEIALLETSTPEYQRFTEMELGDIGAELGVHPVDAMLDITVADKLATTWFTRPTNSDPEAFFDLLRYEFALPGVPAGEWRRVQRARGYRYVLVNGEVTIREDKETGASPGRLLREHT